MNCRSCEHKNLAPVLSLGQMPLANGFRKLETLDQPEPTYPLELMLCENCSLIQLKETVKPEVLFDEYLYFSSNSDTMLHSASMLVKDLIPTLMPSATIIEIASNDGYLLKNYPKEYTVLGIEPAQNIAAFANAEGIKTICDYFSLTLANQLVSEGISADIIHANNVMAHVPNINHFVAGLKVLLKPGGTAIIEVPYLVKMIEDCEFDTIYHEHVYYFSLIALDKLFTRHQLLISDVELMPIHGGSLRLFIKQSGQVSNLVRDLLNKENQLGLQSFNYYANFGERILNLRTTLNAELQKLKKNGKKIAAYGASAKGTTLLNFFGVGKELIEFVVDRSPHKQGYYTPGTSLEIRPLTALIDEKIDYALLLAWNFSDEILMQQASYREQGGKFIIPVPEIKIV